jgi:PleD family two-component response regulator
MWTVEVNMAALNQVQMTQAAQVEEMYRDGDCELRRPFCHSYAPIVNTLKTRLICVVAVVSLSAMAVQMVTATAVYLAAKNVAPFQLRHRCNHDTTKQQALDRINQFARIGKAFGLP